MMKTAFTKACTISLLWMTFGAVYADHECLTGATNAELLNEIGKRLDGQSGGNAQAQATFSCDNFSNLVIELIGLQTGKVSSYQGYSSQCSTDQALFSAKIKKMSSGKLIAWCDNFSRLTKLLLAASADVKLISQNYSAQCQAEADAINADL